MQNYEVMDITLKQQKIISDPLRGQIISLLAEKPMTSKQTAVELGKNPGTIYYHIKQLYEHGILELDHVETVKGIVEKYYKAKTTLFRGPGGIGEAHRVKNRVPLYLSDTLMDDMQEEMYQLFKKYGKKARADKTAKIPCIVEFSITEIQEDKNE
ncbi:ArsR/SmtB family transcription factor [Shouchella clausii]|uniref:ArsR/SmtB family transcription factor n=1 Tax=Shouchella clausii TaxID=79880 RepID=UPI0027116B7B|nr:winged helix-turn-helix domain-containing protein [Shouchella clausii]MDO7270076.1 winged helix-turn-helix domain-containing protein [Shouchella clausii]MDO7289851.1 winged helix-turn-helix domain-containing protein [Shouchella clausii]